MSKRKQGAPRDTIANAARASVNSEKIRQLKAQEEERKLGRSASANTANSKTLPEVGRNTQGNVTNDNFEKKSREKEIKTESKDLETTVIQKCKEKQMESLERTKESVRSNGAKLKVTSGVCVTNPAKPQGQRTRRYHDNLDFYRNKIPSKPYPGHTIKEMLKWKKDYRILEGNHRYIQWLFPIPEGSGMNPSAQPLLEEEAQEMRKDDEVRKRVLEAYVMMLDFYGMRLEDSTSGRVKRSENWEGRFAHLNRSRHNLMRITRILKSLGELGYEHLQAPWVEFILREAIETGRLCSLDGACMMHWIGAVKNVDEQTELLKRFHGLPETPINKREMIASESEDEQDLESEAEVKSTQGVLEGSTYSADRGGLKTVPKIVTALPAEEGDEMEMKGTKQCPVKQVPVETDGMDSEEESAKTDKRPSNQHKPDHRVENTNAVKPITSSATSSHKDQSITLNNSQSKHFDHSRVPGNEQQNSTFNSETQGHGEAESLNKNLQFYNEEILSLPTPGYSIVTMLRHKGDHLFFDKYPYFIQWLFPTRERSESNPECQPLQDHEIKAIREDSKLTCFVLEAYKLVLDYYGMQLKDDIQGQIEPIPETFKDRWQFINAYPENYLRFTRVLTSLGLLGYERFQIPLIEFLIMQGVEKDLLPSLSGEVIMYWLNAVTDEGEKTAMFDRYQALAVANLKLSHGCEFEKNMHASHKKRESGPRVPKRDLQMNSGIEPMDTDSTDFDSSDDVC